MRFHVLTLFPEMLEQGLRYSVLGRAAQRGQLSFHMVDIRDYTEDKHGKVDDYPYGGGAGMLLQAQPVYDAYRSVAAEHEAPHGGKIRTIYVTPQGKTFTQRMARELAREEELVFLCGHYEGVDERVLEEIVDEEISIGDYVLTGGELGAMVLVDSVGRLCEGVLADSICFEEESHFAGLLEYPQYTRPPVWHGREVPEILLTGHHANIHKWRRLKSLERTAIKRPDLFARYEFTDLDKKYLAPPKQKRRKKHRDAAEEPTVQAVQAPDAGEKGESAGTEEAGTSPQTRQNM